MNDLMVFTHIVCTGGGAFSDLLDKYFWQGSIITSKNIAHQLGRPELNTPLKRRDDRNDDILQQYRQRKNRTKVIRGHYHLAYGDREVWQKEPLKFLTFLREPVKRFISHGHYLMTDMDILSRLEKIPEIDFNLQTTYLSGCKTLCATEQDLEIAKRNLEKYDFIGITEEYDDSIELFCKIFSLPYIGWEHNTNAVTKKKNKIPQGVQDRIRELSALDIELYEYGKKLFLQKFEQHKNVELIEPGRFDQVLMKARTVDQYRAKGQRFVKRKLAKDVREQTRLEEFLVN